MTNTLASTFTIGDIAVRQLDGLFSLNDLHKAAGNESRHEPANFLRIEQTKALVEELSSAETQTLKTVIGKGKAQGTYACRELVIAYAAWISAVFHLKVIRVFLNSIAQPALPQSITPAQAQHLRELVQLVVESGKQGHGETWARLHRKLKVNSYLALHPDQFDAACKYLRTKMDDASIAAIAQKHFPQIAQLSAPQHEEPKMPFDITSACAFILGGMFDPRAVAALADACGRVLFRVAVNSDQGPGREIANKIKTLGAADLYAVHVAVAMEAHLRTSPQRVAT